MSERVAAGAERIAAWRGMAPPQPGEWHADVLAESEGERIVVRYEFSAGSAAQVFIAKFYRDATGARTFDHMQLVARHLADSVRAPILSVPEALHYDPSLRMLLQTEARGEPFNGIVDGQQAAPAITQFGRALACLHALPLAGLAVKSMSDHVVELIRPDPRELAAQRPEAAGLVEATLQGLIDREAEWQDTVRSVPLHRDFHLRQLFLDAERVWLIDWDLFAGGDPAFDVAYFVVYLKTHLDAASAAALGDHFLAGYLDNGGDATARERIGAYAAFNYLRRACRRWRLRDAGWQDQFTAMLNCLRSCDL